MGVHIGSSLRTTPSMGIARLIWRRLRESICGTEEQGLPVGRPARRVRSRGLPRKRRMEQKCGIMTEAIRTLRVAGGAGEWPAKKLAHQPCVLPDSPRWRALACLLSHRRPTSLQQPPRRFRAKASCVSGVVFVTLQDGHTLHESRGKRHAFVAGNTKALCGGGTLPDFFLPAPPDMASSLVSSSHRGGRARNV